MGIEFRLLGDNTLSSSSAARGGRLSRITPAVLGRDSVMSRVRLLSVACCCWGRSRSNGAGVDADTMEEMLPETECPGRAVMVLEVSLETRDNGRGINSTVSENPTLARGVGRGGEGATGPGAASSASRTGDGALGLFSIGSDSTGLSTRSGIGEGVSPRSKPAGLVGALLPRGMGCNIMERSWLEMAVDRRWACRPRRPAGGNGAKAKPLSALVGLVLIIESPLRRLPPTYSLPPRRCPWPPPGLPGDGIVPVDCGESGGGGLKRPLSDDRAPGLNLKSGNAKGRDGRSVFPALCPRDGSLFSSADFVRLPEALEYDDGADAGFRPGKTNGGFGGGRFDRGECWGDAIADGGTSRTSTGAASTSLSGPHVVAIVYFSLGDH